MKNTTKLHQMKLTYNFKELEQDYGLAVSLIDAAFDLEVHETKSKKFPSRIVGKKSNILKFLQHLNDEVMGGGEGPEDWERLITPVA